MFYTYFNFLNQMAHQERMRHFTVLISAHYCGILPGE